MEQTYSDTSVGDKIEVYEFLEALGLLDNEVSPVNMDDDDNNESDIDEEDSDDDQANYWDPRKRYTGWNYKKCFGEDALKKLYQAREARHRNIVHLYSWNLPDVFQIYLRKKKIDYSTHSLGLMHLGRKNIMHSWIR